MFRSSCTLYCQPTYQLMLEQYSCAYVILMHLRDYAILRYRDKQHDIPD